MVQFETTEIAITALFNVLHVFNILFDKVLPIKLNICISHPIWIHHFLVLLISIIHQVLSFVGRDFNSSQLLKQVSHEFTIKGAFEITAKKSLKVSTPSSIKKKGAYGVYIYLQLKIQSGS